MKKVSTVPVEPSSTASKKRTTLYAFLASALALFSSLVHIVDSAAPFLALLLPTLGVFLMVLIGVFWGKIPAFRRFIRGFLIAVPGVVLLFGVVMAISFYKDNRDATFGYLMAAYGTLVLIFLQAFLAYMLPAITMTAHYNYRFDLIMVPAAALLNALIITYFALFAVPQGYLYVEYESPTLMNGYALVAWLFTASTILPLLSSLKRGKAAKTTEE